VSWSARPDVRAGSGGSRLACSAMAGMPQAVIFDRDGTLVEDVPYNGDPDRVVPVAGARATLDRLRAGGVALAVVSNQSGVGRGLLTLEQVEAVNHRIEELLGPLGPWFVCPHAPGEGCTCRKPRPGLILDAAAALGLEASACVVVGDQPSDVAAARAAGAQPILVTRNGAAGDLPDGTGIASDLREVADLVLGRS
jgi:histidinol-phosphate phosphatase family protein